MLSLKRTMLLFVLCLTTAAVTAQQKNTDRSPSFANFSATIQLSENTLSNALSLSKGQEALLNLGNDFIFPGTVLSNENVFHNLQTIIIRSSAYNNAVLQISRQLNEDKSISYAGRIFGNGSADGYELKKSSDGNYILQKFETGKILQDCNMQ
ncbi:MAG: hypothetical protein H7X88_00965 [Gloeobacteraceae cyanobacterium ES-bin-316]|nr:hypothetical protein [Ferruginibacter sp.]